MVHATLLFEINFHDDISFLPTHFSAHNLLPAFFLLHRHKVAQWIKKMLFHKQCFENKQFYHVKLISFLCFSVILSRSGDGGRNIV